MSIEQRSPLDVENIRLDFPVLEREVNGEQLVYLDNAATTQKPVQVIDEIERFYKEYNSNVHRGMHTLSQEASEAYEDAHLKAADLIGATGGMNEVVFNSNTTESINTVAFGWAMQNMDKGDNIVLTQMEHHSNLVPWQQVANRTDAELRFIEVSDEGVLDKESMNEEIDQDTALVSVGHMSNVYGTINPVKEITRVAHSVDALTLIDGAQGAPHISVDVEEIGCDFYAFSGHKMLGPTGTGVLYGREEILEEMSPYEFGGEMIKKVSLERATWADLPWKFEAGTPNIAGGIGLGAAIDYLMDIGLDRIHEHERMLTEYTLERLEELDEVEVYGPPAGYTERGGVVSFNVADAHAHDTSDLLNSEGIATRSGHHCAQPLMEHMNIPATSRASFYLYNTEEEADRFVEGIEGVIDVFT